MRTLVKNGTIVTAESEYKADILIVDEKITSIGTNLEGPFDRILDAEGKYVLPGGVDNHAHFEALNTDGITTNEPYATTWVALQGGTVGGLGAGGNILVGPVHVGIHDHLQVRRIAAGRHDNALVRVHGHRGAVILGGLHAGHPAVLDDQLFRGGAEHDLVGGGGLGGRQHGVHRRLEVGAPAARILPESLLPFCMLSHKVCSDNTLPF